MSALRHEPVMLAETLQAMAPAAGETYVDGTFGAGGHALAMLRAAPCRVIGIDRDPTVIDAAAEFVCAGEGRLVLLEGRFGEMAELLRERGVTAVNGVLLDLGVSSMQLDDPQRGFAFSADGPLDMRMGRDGGSAVELVNEASETVLADIIRRYGEERRAGAVARAIVGARQRRRIVRTGELAEIVARAVGGGGRIHPATRTFQAFRIYINDELGELARGLQAAEMLLAPNGRLVVISFHSLEDRAVKAFLRERAGEDRGVSRHRPPVGPARSPSFRLARRGAVKPSREETAGNPRARSARLRAAIRTEAPAWQREELR